ncbi:DUF2254 domain-containing protein [Microbulbifer hydrolyticus]|uniref:DUF2254 domain-containing protein n=1 Tax=Microbulbifer hydrolyticus TaxID=48074 RepID=A0A6P1TD69_9GAMM|nr:DUF2254 domain-containing protein [Microbulbifer hydrolyticus]MBB5209820.1 putative membrane protein [Microbulbifer hydrolyticus]QHQ39635.1 DUF2254 domain-containing protein [Microbulbifer hydrolyticus]
MKNQLLHLSERLRASFWVIPAIMMTMAILLAQGFLAIDQHWNIEHLPGFGWLRLRDPDSARALLSTIAGSTITVAGTVFSITTVALTLASNQFGPRLVRNFIRDRRTQVSLGIFLATFVYALLVMRGIDTSVSDNRHTLTVSFALLMALACIAYLIYFIHNVAQSIQIDNITFNINREFRAALENIYPTEDCRDSRYYRMDLRELNLGEDALSVRAHKEGYIQRIDRQLLIDWAHKHQCCIRLEIHPGAFLYHWGCVARIYNPPRDIDSQTIANAIHGAITLGPQPTAEQDVIFSVRQLAQIAVRALSPGINDPFTAYTCIDRLIDGVGIVLQRPPLPNCFHDDENILRLVTSELDFADVLAAALDEIREYGRDSGVVMRHLLNALEELAEICTRKADRHAMNTLLQRLSEDCENCIEDRFDTATLKKQLATMRNTLD